MRIVTKNHSICDKIMEMKHMVEMQNEEVDYLELTTKEWEALGVEIGIINLSSVVGTYAGMDVRLKG